MTRPDRRTLWTTATLVLWLALATGASAKEKWVEVSSPNFRVLSDAGEGKARRTLVEFERFRAAYESFMAGARPSQAQILVVAVKNHKGLETLVPSSKRKAGRLAGVTVQRTDPSFGPAGPIRSHQIVVRLDAEGERPYTVLYHEYTHVLTSSHMPGVPLWLNEGLAEFWETIEFRDDEVHVGRLSPYTVETVRQRRLPLEELLLVDFSSPLYNEGNRKTSIFYATSWALTHYLVVPEDGRRRPSLVEYIKLVQQGIDSVTAARRAFGDLAQLEEDLNAYVRQLKLSYLRLPSSAKEFEGKTTSRRLSPAEAACFKADFLAGRGNLDLAEPYVDEALASDPGLGVAHEIKGQIQLLKRMPQLAGEHFRKAVELDPERPAAHYYHAMLNLATADATEEALTHLRRAVALDGDFVPALIALALQMGQTADDLEPTRELVWKAVQAEPGSGQLWLWLARVHAANDEREQAEQLARHATRLVVMSGSPNDLNNVCWQGSLAGLAGAVLPACVAAVDRNPSSATIDSRGVARAMVGDLEGAIEDFEHVATSGLGAALIEQRKGWVEELKKGVDPFDPATLLALRSGSRF